MNTTRLMYSVLTNFNLLSGFFRFSPIWQPVSEALAVALTHQASITWPIVMNTLSAVQADLLSGNGDAINASDAKFHQTAKNDLQEILKIGSPEECGGATDASVRLSNLLKVNNITDS